MPDDYAEEASTSGSILEAEDSERVDVAIADALKAQKNRQTVLRFEEEVLEFLGGEEEALYFPLSLSGYQPKLADVKFPEAPEDQKEQPKSLKKKSGDRQSRRDRDSQTSGDTARQSTSSFRSRQQREQDYAAARQRLNLSTPDASGANPAQMGLVPNPYGLGSQPLDINAKAIYRNRQEDLRDPDYQRSARPYGPAAEADRYPRPMPGYFNEHGGYPGMMLPPPYPQPLDASAVQMMQNLSLGGMHAGEQSRYMQPGVPGGMSIQGYQGVPYGYIPGGPSLNQAMAQPGMQAMGMYNHHMPYSYPMAQPYPYIPTRGGQQQVMIGPHMPFYPGSLPAQGYNFPMMQGHPGAYPPRPAVRGSAQLGGVFQNLSPQPSSGGSGGTPFNARRASGPTADKQPRVPSSSSMGSTSHSQHQGHADKQLTGAADNPQHGGPKPGPRS